MNKLKNEFSPVHFENTFKLFTTLIPLLVGSIYLYSLGYTEYLHIPEYPSLFSSINFFINKLIFNLSNGFSASTNLTLLIISIAIFGFSFFRLKRKRLILPKHIEKSYRIQKKQIESSRMHLRSKLYGIRSLNRQRDAEAKEYYDYLLFRSFILFFVGPWTFYVAILIFHELAVFMPIIISVFAIQFLKIFNDKKLTQISLHYLALIIVFFLTITSWLVPYRTGKSLAQYNLEELPLVNWDEFDKRFPSQYIGEENYGTLLWIDSNFKYFVLCKDDKPEVYQVYENQKIFIGNADPIFKNNFCRR